MLPQPIPPTNEVMRERGGENVIQCINRIQWNEIEQIYLV